MQSRADTVERLITEVERYLVVVDAFRGAGCEPHWRREPPPARTPKRKETPCWAS